MLVNNRYELPFHDRARDVVGFRTENGQDIAYDSNNNEVKNWQANNLLDDIIKAAVVLVAAFALWNILGTIIHNPWYRLPVLLLLSAGLVVGGSLLSFGLYFTF